MVLWLYKSIYYETIQKYLDPINYYVNAVINVAVCKYPYSQYNMRVYSVNWI